jgi:hypothetical protein
MYEIIDIPGIGWTLVILRDDPEFWTCLDELLFGSHTGILLPRFI